MLKNLNNSQKLTVYGLGAVTVTVFTSFTFDPVNLPKMLLLVILAFALLPQILIDIKKPQIMAGKIYLGLSVAFLSWTTLSTVLSPAPVVQSFFGVNGRFTGALTYFSFTLIGVSILLQANLKFYRKILMSLSFAGVVNIIYCGYVIIFNKDPIPWLNTYGNILGTFGNPNFVSSFLGIFCVVMIAFVLASEENKKIKILATGLIFLALLEILDSKSRQGLIVFLIGLGTLVVYKIWTMKYSIWVNLVSLFLLLLSGVTAVLGMLQIGPLASIIYKLSVSIRGAYWRAGWETMLQNPIFGAGPDAFGDWYTRVRDARAMVVPGQDVFTNSPHNVFIEQGSNGGIPLFVIFILLNGFVLICGLQYLRKNREYNFVFGASFFGWLGFTAQSLISINQIGLAVWGIVLGAMTVGIYANSIKVPVIENSQINRGKNVKIEKEDFSSLLLAGGATLGLLLAGPAFYADANWRSATTTKELVKIVAAADQWPQSTDRYIQAVKALYESKFEKEALDLTRKALEFNQSSARLWNFLYQMPGSTEIERQNAVKNLKILDPNYKVQ